MAQGRATRGGDVCFYRRRVGILLFVIGFERGFIAGQIVAYEDLVACGSEAKAREAGKLRIEGKEYVMRDGDVVEWRFNV